MPEKELALALRSGFVEIWELAEYFGVTEEMVRFRMEISGGDKKVVSIR
jgi:Zn-dependent peptidase ImmA (M78 family)